MLYSTDTIQETVLSDHAGYTGPTRQHELDHHQVGSDDLSDVYNICFKRSVKAHKNKNRLEKNNFDVYLKRKSTIGAISSAS